MPKDRYLPRNAYQRTVTLGRDGRMSGAWVRPGSLPADRIVTTSLSAINVYAGELYGGTLNAGPNAGGASPPRFSAGDKAKGIQLYDDDGILCFSVSWKNGSGRMGRLGSPGITWANGNMQIDGDALIAGSVQASKLLIGTLGSTFLDEDKLVIGTGWESGLSEGESEDGDLFTSNFSGFYASAKLIGGFHRGAKTWYVDNQTGLIVTKDTTYPGIVYTIMGDGNLAFSNYDEAGSQYTLRFLGYQDEIYAGETRISLATDIRMFTNQEKLIFQNEIDNGWPPVIELRDKDGVAHGQWSGHNLLLTDFDATTSGSLSLDGSGTMQAFISGGTIRLLTNNTGTNKVEVQSDGTLAIYQGMIAFKEKSADPDDPDEGWAVMWMSDGTDSGDDGDVLIKSTAGGVTKLNTIHDHSAGA